MRSSSLHGQLTELTTLASIRPKSPILGGTRLHKRDGGGGNKLPNVGKENPVANESTEDPAAAANGFKWFCSQRRS